MMLRDFYKKKNFILIFSLLLVVACLSAATYAYIIFSINVTNASYNSMTACFDVDYDITNDDGTLPINGTLFHSATPKGGLSGKVAININSSCEAGGIATINLNVESGGSVLFQTVREHCENTKTLQTLTDYKTQTACEEVDGAQWVTNGTALKYAVYEDLTAEPFSTGYVIGTGVIPVYDNIVLSHSVRTMYIYIWLDGELADNSYANIAFEGSVGATVEYVDDSSGNEAQVFNFEITSEYYEHVYSAQSEEGMTWEEWVNSDYNTLDVHIDGDVVWIHQVAGVNNADECTVFIIQQANPSDIINSETQYTYRYEDSSSYGAVIDNQRIYWCPYTASLEITWREWIASSHNTQGYTLDDVAQIKTSSGQSVLTDDIIGWDDEYYLDMS